VSTLAKRFTVEIEYITVISHATEGCQAITVDEETFDLLTETMVEYDCGSVAEAVNKSATTALETDESDLAQLLADRLSD